MLRSAGLAGADCAGAATQTSSSHLGGPEIDGSEIDDLVQLFGDLFNRFGVGAR